MLKVNVMRRQRSGHREHDYIMITGQPEDILGLIESLTGQFAGFIRDGHGDKRTEPQFEGHISEEGKEPDYMQGYFSIALVPEMRCAHPGCLKTFDARNGPFAAAFRKPGLVCVEHEREAKWMRPPEMDFCI